MGITLQKIAKLANVSVSTASRALRNSKEIHEDTARLVREIALKYGYQMDKKNALLKNQKQIAPNIAILCPEIVSIHYSKLATKIACSLKEAGAVTHIFISDFSEKNRWEILKKCFESMEINGAVGLFNQDFVHDIGLPFVCVGKSGIIGDVGDGMYRALVKAKESNYKKFLFLGECLTKYKKSVFEGALEKAGISPEDSAIYVSELRFEEAGFDGMTKILDGGVTLPAFCLCAYDEIAIGAMKVLRDRGVRIPEEMAIMGMNNIPVASYVSPTLSSMEFDEEMLCDSLTKMILKAVLEKSPEHEQVLVPYRLYLRESFE